MNERVQELWDKAAESTAAYPSGQNNSWETQVNFMVKFAELIVRECIDIAGKEDFDVMMKEGYPCSQTAKKIKEHFGVEE